MNYNKKTGIFPVFLREVRRMQVRPLYILFTLILPIFLFVIVTFLLEQGVPRNLPVAVFDADNSALSRQIVRMIDATPSISVDYRVRGFKEGKDFILRKKCYALIVLPKNLEKDVYKGKSPRIINYASNIYMMPASMIKKAVMTVAGTVNAGINMKRRLNSGEMEAKAMASIMPLKVDVHNLFNPYVNYQYFLASGFMPAIFQMFVMVCAIYAFGIELKMGTAAEWLACAGGSTWKAITGKMLPYTINFIALGISLVTLLIKYIGVPLNGSPLIIILSMILMVLAIQAVALFFVSLVANLRISLMFGAGMTAIAFTFSGLTFPQMAMPLSVRYIGETIPLTHFLRVFFDQSFRGAPVQNSVMSLAILLLFSTIPFFLMSRWEKLLTEEKYWGNL